VNHGLANWALPIGANTLNVTASWRKSRTDRFFDSDATEALVASTHFDTGSTDKSIDVHLASADDVPFQWLVGATLLRFDQRHRGEPTFGVDLATPDFEALARSFGIEAETVDGLGDDFGRALTRQVATEAPTVLVARAALEPPPTTSPRWYRRTA